MNCPKCGKSSFEGVNFCSFCGIALKAARVRPLTKERENLSLQRLHMRRPLLTLLSFLLIAAVAVPALFVAGGCGQKRGYSEKALKWHVQGESYLKSGNYNEAITAFSNAIKIEPRYKEAYKNRGNVYYDLKQYDKAADDYYMAIEIDPEYPNPYCNIGNILYNEGKYDEAIEKYSKAINLDPDFGIVYRNRAHAKEKSAKDDYKKACELGVRGACSKY